ncbi:MAG: 4-phosphoerythronate dehydrogenase PdxB [Bacteroidetes bacterium]|nr:4-phosphoerythronate dehydrogenase PdxB [Bacteroidota bacterium]
MKIVADNKIPFLKGVLEPFAEIEYLAPGEITKATVKDADALLVRTRTKCDASLLDGSNVKFIATATIGFDHIDAKYCDVHNIKWISAPGCNSSSVMQYISSALLTLAEMKNLLLPDLTIGIVGVGNVGTKVARAAKAFGMKVLLNDPPRSRAEGNQGFVDLDELISRSDIITFHVPLNKEGRDKTLHMADESFFNKFDREKIIINTSRGEVVNTSALKNAINNKVVKACVLDVWENEPDIDRELVSLVNIATPHIAGYSADGKANGTAVCVRAISSFFNFGIDPKWYPLELPQPTGSKLIMIDCTDKPEQQISSEAVFHTYKILDDDGRLRSSVGTFEKQRGSYPVRREFPFYDIVLENCRMEIVKMLNELGFNIQSK